MPEDSAARQAPADARLYHEAKQLFEETLELSPEHRAGYVAQRCAAGSDLYREVFSLLENHDRAAGFFEGQALPDTMIGRQIGLYKVLRPLGMGGMGAVYLAERADGEFRKLVALKAVRAGLIDENVLRRFRNERQTLAVLDHPNIIKLLDAGATDQGVPYLVTEYVEGQPIDAYCASRKLSIRERVELFRVVLGAVHCAHQNLVVHRDLKPSNILVTPDGVPKLLDFGIAKLLRAEYSVCMGITRTALQPMTPEFASPEQILGQPITTATDIYALGVILYRLLTGRHPYELTTGSVMELERAVCETEPEKPSKLAARAGAFSRAEVRSLHGDLDTIVLLAMRKEPQRRYPSVLHFSEDLRRYLEGWPVGARRAGVLYKTSKFAGRNKVPCAMAVLLVAGLAASGAVALRERQLAQRRFTDLRSFANFVLNDLDAKLRDGILPARKALATWGLEYLDSLVKENGDATIQSDLINGYIKNGDVWGNLYGSNLGDMARAEANFRSALQLAEQVGTDQQSLLLAQRKLGEFLAGAGKPLEALQHLNKALGLSERLSVGRPPSLDMLKDRFYFWSDIASANTLLSDFEEAVTGYRFALETAQSFPTSYSSRPVAIAMAQELAAYCRARSGDAAGAEQTISESIATYRASLKSTRQLRLIAKADKNLADVQRRTGKNGQALASISESIRATSELRAKDPDSEEYQLDFQQALMMEIEILTAGKQDAKAETKRALDSMKPWAERPDAPYQHAADYAELLATTTFAEFRDDAAALQYASKAVSLTSEKDPDALHVLALAYERKGDARRAAEFDEKARSLLPPVKPGRQPPEFRSMLDARLARFAAMPATQGEQHR